MEGRKEGVVQKLEERVRRGRYCAVGDVWATDGMGALFKTFYFT